MIEVTLSPVAGTAAPDPARTQVVAITLLTTLGLLLPALWNGFPLVFHDSGGYLMVFAARELGFGRSLVYGAFLAAGMSLAFWPCVVLQAGVAAWLLVTTLRAHGVVALRARLVILAILIIGTSLPWYAGQIMPDLWVALAALALYLLAFRVEQLGAIDKSVAIAIVAFAAASHMATLALITGLVIALAATRLIQAGIDIERPTLSWPAIALIAGIFTALISNTVIAGRLAFTPGASNFLFARLVHTGLAAKYLEAHCPDPSLLLCQYRGRMPTQGEAWLWEPDSPLNSGLGGWVEFAPEARRIVLDSMRDDPLAHAAAALSGTVRQFARFATGDGLVAHTSPTSEEIERQAPQYFAAFLAARQQRDGFDFTAVNAVHVPVAAASLIGLLAVIVAGRRRRRIGEFSCLAGFVLVTLIGNAIICGAFSVPNPRYQSRLVWLAPLAVALAWAGRRAVPVAPSRSADGELPPA